MATITPTSIGPVGARQVNTSFYVWGGFDVGFTTMQQAVDYVASVYGAGEIVIVHGHGQEENIGSLTGGMANIIILDQRDGTDQRYSWNGTQFIPIPFQQLNGFISQGKPASLPAGSAAYYFDPTGTTGIGKAHIDFTANPGLGMPTLNITGHPSDGTPAYTFFRFEFSRAGFLPAEIPQLDAPLVLGLFNDGFDNFNLWTGEGYATGGKGMTVWAKAAENAIDFQGLTIGGAYDQTIRLNYLGGNVQIGPITFNSIGDIVGIGDIAVTSIAADDADFDTCEVNNSPVRTFANTPDGPGQGMVWPTAGIPVSLGDHWQDPSINPASLATWPTAGVPVSTGSAWGTSINPATLANFPPAGIAVSTGTAWGTAIDPTTIPRLNVSNTFTAIQHIAAENTTYTWRGNVVAASIDLTQIGMTTSWNLTQSTGEADFINVGSLAGSGGFHWYNTWLGGPALNAANFIMSLDSLGTLIMAGQHLRIGDRSAATWTAGTPNISASTVNMIINPSTTGNLFLNWDMGAGVNFGNGSATPAAVASIDKTGNITSSAWIHATGASTVPTVVGVHAGARGDGQSGQLALIGPGAANSRLWMIEGFSSAMQFSAFSDDELTTKTTWLQASRTGTTVTGVTITLSTGGAFTVTGGSKNFAVPDPIDESKMLIHSCLEGPEIGVFYRGEATTENGRTEVTLPDYFEAMTFTEDRSVLLTQIDDQEEFALLAASRITDGKFRITSSTPIATVAWEVKAVRRLGVDRLKVREPIADREDLMAPPKTQEEDE